MDKKIQNGQQVINNKLHNNLFQAECLSPFARFLCILQTFVYNRLR